MLALLDVESLLAQGGLLLLAGIVFAESGLLVGFFLPGDSLLFVAGFLASSAGGRVIPGLPWVIAVTVTAAIAGDQVGYLFGRRVGPALFSRPRSRLFDPAHAERARVFFDRHGPRTIVLARFVPVVRTFAPIVAGIGRMEYSTFLRYNVVGGIAWGAGLPFLGHFLGEIDLVKENIEATVIAIVVVSLLPVAREFVAHRRGRAH